MIGIYRGKEEIQMEWLTAVRKSIEYIEGHLNDNISAQDVAEQVYVSQLHFQRGWQ